MLKIKGGRWLFPRLDYNMLIGKHGILHSSLILNPGVDFPVGIDPKCLSLSSSQSSSSVADASSSSTLSGSSSSSSWEACGAWSSAPPSAPAPRRLYWRKFGELRKREFIPSSTVNRTNRRNDANRVFNPEKKTGVSDRILLYWIGRNPIRNVAKNPIRNDATISEIVTARSRRHDTTVCVSLF